jgi:serine/threonine-protein kinase
MASNVRLAEHPHIVEIMDFRCEQETGQAFAPYVVMEYIAGPSLRTCLMNRSVPDETTVKLIGQACDALHFAHGQRTVHGSIKTDNILLTETGGAKLVDFRIGELGGTLESVLDGRCIPDPKYTSCEQAQGLAPTPLSDQYSLGVVLYELLTGRAPFTGSILEVIDKHKTQTPEKPTAIRASIDRRAEEVALRALGKDPNERYASMEEMARALGYNEPFYTGDG